MLKGVAYSFIPLSLILLSICTAVIFRTPKDIKRVTTFYEETPELIQTEELPRMQSVMKSFIIVKKVEAVIIFIGILLAFIFWKNEIVRGVAIGLIIQGTIMYAFDHFAQARGEPYIQLLKTL